MIPAALPRVEPDELPPCVYLADTSISHGSGVVTPSKVPAAGRERDFFFSVIISRNHSSSVYQRVALARSDYRRVLPLYHKYRQARSPIAARHYRFPGKPPALLRLLK